MMIFLKKGILYLSYKRCIHNVFIQKKTITQASSYDFLIAQGNCNTTEAQLWKYMLKSTINLEHRICSKHIK